MSRLNDTFYPRVFLCLDRPGPSLPIRVAVGDTEGSCPVPGGDGALSGDLPCGDVRCRLPESEGGSKDETGLNDGGVNERCCIEYGEGESVISGLGGSSLSL